MISPSLSSLWTKDYHTSLAFTWRHKIGNANLRCSFDADFHLFFVWLHFYVCIPPYFVISISTTIPRSDICAAFLMGQQSNACLSSSALDVLC